MTAVDDTETPAPTLGAPLSDPTANHTDVVSAARSYAELGWRVVPIKPGEKRPALNAWQNVATTDPATIDLWWTTSWLLGGEKVDGAACGVGIATGPDSDVFVLDVDVAGDKRGDRSLAQLEATHGPLPATVEAITPSGGRHLYFQWPLDTDVATNANRLGQHLDIRGHGGQVLAPPTAAPTVHPGAPPYRWADDRSPDDITVADAPRWLLALLEPDEPAPAPTTPTLAAVPPMDSFDDDSPAAWFNATTTWADLLTADGWTLHQTLPNGEQRWVRPGKNGRDGISATVGHQGRDCLKVFTSSVPGLDADVAYSRFGYQAAMHHAGDRSALASHLRRTQMPTVHDDLSWTATAPLGEGVAVAELDPVDPWAHAHLIDWDTFWAKDRNDQQWCVWPLVPAGRAVALYAPAKAGKSTVLLAAVTAATAGHSAFGGPTADEPPEVLYLDYEMTEDDLEERLEELGYGPDADLSRLHYALLPSLDPLDTQAGAAHVVALAEHVGATLVVIDTFGRAVEGEEDRADTVRAFYRHTGLALKTRGIAVLRTDHAGKEKDRGQRGSSAKADDVDIVWRLERTDDGTKLMRTHSRISWVPAEVEMRRDTDTDTGVVSFRVLGANQHGAPAGTKAAADLLDELGIPVDATRNAARAALKDAGKTVQNKVLGPALRYRRERAQRDAVDEMTGNASESGPPARRTVQNGPKPSDERTEADRTQNSRSEHADRPNGPGGPTPHGYADRVPPYRGDRTQPTRTEHDNAVDHDDLF